MTRPPGLRFPGDWAECNAPEPLERNSSNDPPTSFIGVAIGVAVYWITIFGFIGWFIWLVHKGQNHIEEFGKPMSSSHFFAGLAFFAGWIIFLCCIIGLINYIKRKF